MSDTSIKLYTVTVTSPELKLLINYLQSNDSPAFAYVNDVNGFLAITGDDGLTNKDRIFNTYTGEEKVKYFEIDPKYLPIKVGTVFTIPADKIQRNSLLADGVQIVSNSDVAFKAKALFDIENDKGYVRIETPIQGQITKGTTKEIAPEISVWVWCRALSDRKPISQQDNGSYEMEGEIFDVTPFISNLTTNVTAQTGGNFEFTLPPLIASMDQSGKWVIQEDSLKMYANPKNLSTNQQGYIAEASLFDSDLNRNKFLFHHIISTNDLVLIRFERLNSENDTREVNESLNVDRSKIAGNIYDMIGLVDLDSSAVNPMSNDGQITIRGRDLSKLFIDDGTYFYALEQSQGKLNFAGGSSEKNSLMQRVFSENALLYFSLYFNNSIEQVFKFVIQQLSTIKVVPDILFESYGDKRNTKYTELDYFKGKPVQGQQTTYVNQAKTGISQLITNNIFELSGIADILDANHSVLDKIEDATSDTNINGIFQNVKGFLQAIRDNKVRKVKDNTTIGWGSFTWNNSIIHADTLPDYFINNNIAIYPYYQNGLGNEILQDVINNVDKLIDLENSQTQYKKEFDKQLAAGIWQIVKLSIDNSVIGRRIVDSSMSSANGSLINFFKKVCQSPFVEFIMDTYADVYNITVRKPPTDQASLISLIEGKVTTEDGRVQTVAPPIVDIEAYDMLNENLYFDDADIYSWYHLSPRYLTLGDNSYSYFYLPAIFFDEYAERWGSRPMDLSHNYYTYTSYDPQSSQSLDATEKQAIYDLKYLIESNQYSPFTRKGTIVLNGDRRIKVGNVIRYKPTGEIFFVDAVQQSYKIGESNIDRTTTVFVSRGMVEQLIYGIPVDGGNQETDHIGYFNIINTKLNLNYKKVVTTNTVTDTKYIYPTAQKTFDVAPGFVEYMKHQQGAYGYSQIMRYVFNPALDDHQYLSIVSPKLLNNMMGNVGNDFPGGKDTLTAFSFIDYWKKKYTNAYNEVIGGKTPFDYIYAKVSNDTGVPFNILRTFGQIESGNKNVGDNGKGYVGIMQLSATVAKEVGVTDRTDPEQSIRGAAAYYLKNSGGVTYNNTSPEIPQKINTTKDVQQTIYALDRENVFSNFKVNRHVFNFFVRGEQFRNEYTFTDVNRQIYKKCRKTH